MEAMTVHATHEALRPRLPAQPLVPITEERRATLPTSEAAAHLGRAPQTLRLWASGENGPLRPLRINGRLAWPVAEIRRLLGVGNA